jgi:hypothetical protein
MIYEDTVEMRCSTFPWNIRSTFLWNYVRKSTTVYFLSKNSYPHTELHQKSPPKPFSNLSCQTGSRVGEGENDLGRIGQFY